VPLPKTSALKRVFVGIGGSLHPGSKLDIDIDISAVFVSTSGAILGAVDGDVDEMYGVSHSGDQLAGEHKGAGDDEAISIDLAQVPTTVRCIFLVLSVSRGNFSQIRNTYARIIDQTATELVRYDIRGSSGSSHTGLIIAKLMRSRGRGWGFMAIGGFYDSTCRTWKGATAQMEILLQASQDHHEEHESPKATSLRLEEAVPVTASAAAEADASGGGGSPEATKEAIPRTTTSFTRSASCMPRSTATIVSWEAGGSGSGEGFAAISSAPTPRTSILNSEAVCQQQARPAKRGSMRLTAAPPEEDQLLVDDEEAEGPRRRVCAPCARPLFGMCCAVEQSENI